MPIISSIGGASARGFGRTFSSREPVSLINTFSIPNSTIYVAGDTITFTKPANTVYVNVSTGIYTFPVRNGVNFRVQLYGGGGGYFNDLTNQYGANPNGGVMDAVINLSTYQNTNLYIVRGGGGQNSASGNDQSEGIPYSNFGFNGGGYGGGNRGGCGGGRTDLRTGNPSGVATTNSLTELLVAGGGGGGFGTLGITGNRYQGINGCYGSTGSYPYDTAGGGGGYYGGNSDCGDDSSNGGSGSNYYDATKTITVNTNGYYTARTGGNDGNGYFIITVLTTS